MGKKKYLSAFEQGMVVGARRNGLCQELQRCWVFHAQQFPEKISSQLDTAVFQQLSQVGWLAGTHKKSLFNLSLLLHLH